MLTIILKIILCSSVCITVYYLFLEKEKMYRFNRFYLLFSLVLSYVIPFISITVQQPKPENKPQLIFEDTAQQIILAQPVQDSFNWIIIVWIIYGVITFFFLIRSILSIRAVKKMQGEKRIYQNQILVVTKENLSPFSFWNTIYLGEDYIKNNVIDPRIFLHEKSHLEQKHSIDLIFMDVLKIFTWFNPVLLFYKKAIITNHEFLADEAVLNSRYNVKEYQNLILEEIINIQNIPFTHTFNFNNTKKRFIMMTAKKSKFILLKKTAGITVIIVAAALFTERTYANSPTPAEDVQKISSNVTSSLSTQDPYQDFKDILSKYSDLLNQGKYAEFSKKVSDDDKKKLEELYPYLTDTQKNEQKIIFFNTPDLIKKVPTENELKSFLDKSNYAVWIDSKKVDNSSLNRYKTSDFASIIISGVSKNARTAKNPQPYQVSLMTHDYFEKKKEEKPHTAMGIKKESIKEITDAIPLKETTQTDNNEGKNTNINTNQNTTEAEYPGGKAALRKKIGMTVDTSLFSSKNGTLSSTVYIHIDENGKGTKVTGSGNNEVFTNEIIKTAELINNETVWKPATKDGKAVASIYKLPATMTFQ
ncbi:beta-lactamase regulating signal transducer with metallopeptidase domain [Chryseobacterium sp. 52]|uniref:M56 family metallopeptidase n=1 Tax=Chryseobacterium sp. 52 TaxID=2035213 RepID=UPI000C1828EC|nr:M56 family metallopeptidase [Chryseobacterium sp. 52]PIF43961.1 beta-lactamase regulating signal transducer with metallopeptidase domain [Chryseobacterium sp. 52]